MAKVFPNRSIVSSSFGFMTVKRETFTVWMKSLVCHTNGCTVFDSTGNIIYRVENYDKKSSSEVFLMDVRGRVVATIIRRKKLLFFRRWYGYGENMKKEEPWFIVKRNCGICLGNVACEITLGIDKFWIVKSGQKAAFRIVNFDDKVIAEVKQKQSSSGVGLGGDVLTLIVEPQIDHSFIIAILTVYGLINNIM